MKITADDFRRIMHPELRDPETEERRQLMLIRLAEKRAALSSKGKSPHAPTTPDPFPLKK